MKSETLRLLGPSSFFVWIKGGFFSREGISIHNSRIFTTHDYSQKKTHRKKSQLSLWTPHYHLHLLQPIYFNLHQYFAAFIDINIFINSATPSIFHLQASPTNYITAPSTIFYSQHFHLHASTHITFFNKKPQHFINDSIIYIQQPLDYNHATRVQEQYNENSENHGEV